MKPRELEREIIDILRGSGFEFIATADSGDTLVRIGPYDLPVEFNVSIFAQELAQRMESK